MPYQDVSFSDCHHKTGVFYLRLLLSAYGILQNGLKVWWRSDNGIEAHGLKMSASCVDQRRIKLRPTSGSPGISQAMEPPWKITSVFL
jgi:hypothetical protein